MSKEAIYVGSGKKPENFDLINISIAESKVVDYWKNTTENVIYVLL